jgi:hypothetical protein
VSAWALSAFALGCGRSLPEQANPEKARQALEMSLDAWRKGESIPGLAKGSPVIYFNDPKVQKGMQLSAFTIEDGHDFFGQSVRLSATLSFARDGGATKERTVVYLVDTSPVIVIVPD